MTAAPNWTRRDILPTRGSTGFINWSAEDDGRLRLMWAEGVPCKDIARELRRKIPAIHYRAMVLELPSRRRSNATKPKPPPVIAAVPVEVPAPSTGLPADLRYVDDPRAEGEFDPLPAVRRGDMTAVLMGDPAPGRSAA